ncbi:hypothetical protein EDC01DRAFT_778318 [Geopyxis carbonaria]|nr:hypothetical protein EDC01DRAFT_778318 [Geopyxis carbonaria]
MPDAIALVSGGKDSLLALYHAVQNGYTIVALGNLHPPTVPSTSSTSTTTSSAGATTVHNPTDAPTIGAAALLSDELDSYMYQTIGHSLLPLLAHCLSLPLYRRAIVGTSANTDLNYQPTASGAAGAVADETEDLTALLTTITAAHPSAVAVTSGAILSAYQRTRIESVCSRLGLTSLAYLWRTPQPQILHQLASLRIDARIVKVAALGLDAAWLWRNVADAQVQARLAALKRRWGINVAGEGGEYETLVVDAPGWRGRIVVDEEDRVVGEDGGAAWLGFRGARVEGEQTEEGGGQERWGEGLERPELLEERFAALAPAAVDTPAPMPAAAATPPAIPATHSIITTGNTIHINNLTAPAPSSSSSSPSDYSLSTELQTIFTTLLSIPGVTPSSITSTTLLLSSMSLFASVNALYSTYFPSPLPPARVCLSLPLPPGMRVALSATATLTPGEKTGLHVQSRSHWAPANIGPYSQAICGGRDGGGSGAAWYIAGQIPLIPASLEVAPPTVSHAALSLQHACRVADAVGARIVGAVAWVTDAAMVREVVGVWEGFSGGVDGVVVAMAAGLPRGVGVEWAVYAQGGEGEEGGVRVEFDGISEEVEGAVDVVAAEGREGGWGTAKVLPCFGVWDGEGVGRRWATVRRIGGDRGGENGED